MELEDRVCSLELSKRLNELGVEVEQDSCFYWVRPPGMEEWVCRFYGQLSTPTGETANWDQIPAFTVAELGEMLPGDDTVASRKLNSSWRSILYDFRGLNHYFTQAKTEADARAKMLIYLLEKGLVTPCARKKSPKRK